MTRLDEAGSRNDIVAFDEALFAELILSDEFYILSKACGWLCFAGYRVRHVLGYKNPSIPPIIDDPDLAVVTFAYRHEARVPGIDQKHFVLFSVPKHSLRLAPTAFEHLLGDAFEED